MFEPSTAGDLALLRYPYFVPAAWSVVKITIADHADSIDNRDLEQSMVSSVRRRMAPGQRVKRCSKDSTEGNANAQSPKYRDQTDHPFSDHRIAL
jgi:hypothetical protein